MVHVVVNWVAGHIRWPRLPEALAWCKQLIRQETRIFLTTDPFAADFLADQALLNPDPDLCEDCALVKGLDFAYRYQGELRDGIQN